MKGDFSRSSFDPVRHATSVRKQQGRVDLDADWNEQQDIAAHLRATALRDVIGTSGAPIDDAGLGVVPAGADLRLTAGRYYVEGMLCENETDALSIFAQDHLPAGSPVVLGADGVWRPAPPNPDPGVYVAYVDVWTRHLTVVEDPSLREIALGGPDTTTRTQTVWQVRLMHAGAPGATVTCGDEPARWAAETSPSSGTLRAWSDPTGTPTDDCIIPLSAPYRGLDNQLYRVEIRDPGAPGAATYVWSRDNGSVCASWVGRDGDVLTVKSPGRDGSTGFTNGCWLQLVDDTAELQGRFGTLAQVDRAEGDQLILKAGTATGSLALGDFPSHPRVRRWDGHGTTPADGSDVPLELGVEVAFASSATASYRAGDHWSFEARALLRDVIWPRSGGAPVALTPHGTSHAYDRLAVVSFDGASWKLEHDCRALFAPLADQRTLSYLGGDGQAVAPVVGAPATLVTLPQRLMVAVTMGGRPVEKARVRFGVSNGNGTVDGTAPPGTVVVESAADGVASVEWRVDSSTVLQEVVAELLDDGDQPLEPALTFSATLLTAAGISYDPAGCANLGGATTVQDAIDRLCGSTGGGCSTLVLSPGPGWVEALESLPADSDASICFRPGVYQADRGAVIENLRHVRLSGGGRATRLEVASGESALTFERCASVVVEDLGVSVGVFPGPPVAGQLGVITIVDTPEVTLHRLTVQCPTGSDPRATCITVRMGGEQRSAEAARHVRVTECELLVGHAQTGLLIVNVERATVIGNAVTTYGSMPGTDRLMVSPAQRARLVNLLVRDLVAEPATRTQPEVSPGTGLGGFNTRVKVGNWFVGLNSTVPTEEWQALVAANPPTPAEIETPEAVNGFLNRIVDLTVEQPTILPSFERNVRLFSERLRPPLRRFEELQPAQPVEPAQPATELPILAEARRGFLIAGEPLVVPVVARPARSRSVQLPAGNLTVRFDSVLPQQTWNAVLEVAPPTDVGNPLALAKHLRGLAARMLTDAAFGDRFAGAFLAGLRVARAAVASQGIVIAGHIVGEVLVAENDLSRVSDAIHVAASFRRSAHGPTDSARDVRVRDNKIRVEPSFSQKFARRGIFVGNVDRVIVDGNSIAPGTGGVLSGIELRGAFGAQLLVRQNYMTAASGPILEAITIVPVGGIPAGRWAADYNVMIGATTGINAPGAVVRNENAP